MLQREINIVVRNNFIEASSDWAGTSGDHRSTVLVFDIQENELINSGYTYKLQLNDAFALLEPEEDKLRFEIPQSVLFETDILQIQLTISDGEEQVYVSDILDFCVSPNLCTDGVEVKYDGLLEENIENFNNALSKFERLCNNFPYVDKSTLTWWVFDGETGRYTDTKISAVWGAGDMPEKFVKPLNLSFVEYVSEYHQILPNCQKSVGGINDYGQIDSSIKGFYTYTVDGGNYVREDVINTQYCEEVVFVNSGGVDRRSLNSAITSFETRTNYTFCYIVVSASKDVYAKAWYENYNHVDQYVITDEKMKKAIADCIN